MSAAAVEEKPIPTVIPATSSSSTMGEETSEQMTEEEAALYDRQLRLWGSVAQSRIRQCRVLLTPFDSGVAIEVAKNLILAGVKEIVLLDDGEVSDFSLAAGFVWREEDVGKKRVEAALPRLASLNPHVKITPLVQPPTLENIQSQLSLSTEPSSSTSSTAAAASPLSSLVYTISNPFAPSALPLSSLQTLSQLSRASSVRFHLATSQGLNGCLFQDLGATHQFLVEKKFSSRNSRNALVEKVWNELQQESFVTLQESMSDSEAWKSRNKAAGRRKIKNSEGLWGVWALWEILSDPEEQVQGPEDILPSLLLSKVDELLKARGLDGKTLWDACGVDEQEWAETFLLNSLPTHPSQPADFAPTTAVLGGILSQEILNSVGGREQPKVDNWMVWYGLKGQAPVFRSGAGGEVRAVKTGTGAAVEEAPPQ